MSPSSFDLLCHIASVLEAFAFLQHDVILLRSLEAVSAAMIAAYSFVHTRLLTDCHFIWACINFVINAQHLIAYYYKLWSLRLTAEEQALWKEKFPFYHKNEFGALKEVPFALHVASCRRHEPE
jgi:hypothetical protein